MSSAAVDYARQNQPRFLDELKELLRIPSISTLPEHNGDTRRAAEALAAEMKRIGLEHVRLIETAHGGGAGHPLVYGDWLHAIGKPTVLCYGHYDVQPPDPLDEWLTPPFEPTERDGNLYARGAVDDKGQMYMHLKALESLFQSSKEGTGNGKLPLNVRVILEGEEEVGGEGIANFVREHPEELKADFALVLDTEMFAPELPTLCVGLRGMIYTEIEVRGAKTDLHSGTYGGAAPNPFVALAQIIAGLRDREGKIQIPGFYDDVEAPSAEEKAAWKRLPFDEEHYRESKVGSPVLTGEAGYSVLERTWARPTLDVHGMPGGFTGAGAKTVIPARATAKVSMRLVPAMTAKKSFAYYKAFVESLTPKGVTVEVRMIHAADPLVVRTDNPYVTAAEAAMREVFGKETVFVRGGGSIPIVGDIERYLKIPAVMMGFGLPDDNMHAPNEKFHIANFHRGIESVIRMLELLGRLNVMDAEGWVLAGGRSLRMGRDKAAVVLAGRPLLQRMLDKLEPLHMRARVAGLRAPIAGVTAEVLSDAYPDCGPLSGMETALTKSEAPLVLIVGVDLPLLETEFLAWMLRRAATTGAKATIPRVEGQPQPLCAVYRRELLDGVTGALETGDYKMMVAVERAARGGRLDCFDVERVGATGAWRSTRATHWQFMNCNTPEELALAAGVLAGKHFF